MSRQKTLVLPRNPQFLLGVEEVHELLALLGSARPHTDVVENRLDVVDRRRWRVYMIRCGHIPDFEDDELTRQMATGSRRILTYESGTVDVPVEDGDLVAGDLYLLDDDRSVNGFLDRVTADGDAPDIGTWW